MAVLFTQSNVDTRAGASEVGGSHLKMSSVTMFTELSTDCPFFTE